MCCLLFSWVSITNNYFYNCKVDINYFFLEIQNNYDLFSYTLKRLKNNTTRSICLNALKIEYGHNTLNQEADFMNF